MNFLNFPIPYFVLLNAELKLLIYLFYGIIYSGMFFICLLGLSLIVYSIFFKKDIL